MRNAGLEETQAGINITRRNINNLRYTDDITLIAEREEELKMSFLMKVKEENEKAGLKVSIQKMKTMASSLIPSWQTDGETVADFIFLGFKITWRRKRQPTPVLLPGRSHGRRNLVRYSPRGHKESDMTE